MVNEVEQATKPSGPRLLHQALHLEGWLLPWRERGTHGSLHMSLGATEAGGSLTIVTREAGALPLVQIKTILRSH
jgi:hypothetical protein